MNFSRLTFLMFALSFVACACGVSGLKIGPQIKRYYVPATDNGRGYSDKKLGGGIRIATYEWNEESDKYDAEEAFWFSRFRAMEQCHEAGKKYTAFLKTVDQTESETVQRSKGNSIYGSHVGFTHVTTREDKILYPKIETYYACGDHFNGIDAKTRYLKAEDVKMIVSDVMGAMQVIEVSEGSPLQYGDIIIKVNDVRASDITRYYLGLHSTNNTTQVKLKLIREGQVKELSVPLIDSTDTYASDYTKSLNESCQYRELSEMPICKR